MSLVAVKVMCVMGQLFVNMKAYLDRNHRIGAYLGIIKEYGLVLKKFEIV